jgi:polysaccharide export outer membrane protein
MFILINNKNFLLIFSILMISVSSCVSKYKINYFQQKNESNDSLVANTVNSNYTPVFKFDDYLSIEVTSQDEESTKLFTLNSLNNANQMPNYSNGIAATNGYLIDANGFINMPVIGEVKLVGLNRMEATELIKSKLIEFIANPIVNIRIQNFKVTVLGDVRIPGSYNIPNERITLPEIIGVAGDLNITGLRNNILVIRDINGIKTEYRVDLTSKDIFKSPAYFLTQNDVIYIEPNRAKRNSSMISSTAGVLISITSLVVTTINLVTK